jgi:tRNA threonylcarbamoyladenosine biosynthesis protein TsaE
MERIIPDLAELEHEARNFLATLAPKEHGATLITLSGDLGAGKTAFTKLIAKALGVEEHVTSPTFVLEKIYALPKGNGFAKLAHIDAYRLTDAGELAALGFDELMSDEETLVLLEWPERVSDMLATPTVRITLEALDDGSRKLTYA